MVSVSIMVNRCATAQVFHLPCLLPVHRYGFSQQRDPDLGKNPHEDGAIYPLEGCPHLPHASIFPGTEDGCMDKWTDGWMYIIGLMNSGTGFSIY